MRTVICTEFPGMLNESTYGTLCCNMICELLNDVVRGQLVDTKLEGFADQGIEIPDLFTPNNGEVGSYDYLCLMCDRAVPLQVIDTIMSILFLLSELPNSSVDTITGCLANLQSLQTTDVLTDFDDDSFTLVHTGVFGSIHF